MDNSLYLERLITFNSTEKYQKELDFLMQIMTPINKDEKILDYGCGIGTTIRYLKNKSNADIYGFDIYKYIDKDLVECYLSEVKGKFNRIIFLHSFAHIPNVSEILTKLKNHLFNKAEIIIITPNKVFDDYFKELKKQNYKPDTTVFMHYSSETLQNILLSCGYEIKVAGTFGNLVENIHERCFCIATYNNI